MPRSRRSTCTRPCRVASGSRRDCGSGTTSFWRGAAALIAGCGYDGGCPACTGPRLEPNVDARALALRLLGELGAGAGMRAPWQGPHDHPDHRRAFVRSRPTPGALPRLGPRRPESRDGCPPPRSDPVVRSRRATRDDARRGGRDCRRRPVRAGRGSVRRHRGGSATARRPARATARRPAAGLSRHGDDRAGDGRWDRGLPHRSSAGGRATIRRSSCCCRTTPTSVRCWTSSPGMFPATPGS